MKISPVQIPQRPKGLKFEALAVDHARFEADAQAATIDIFDSITPDTPSQIADARRQIGNRPLTVRMNSLGGDPFAGMSAYNLLAAHGDVTVEVLGIVASAASVIAMAGNTIKIASGAQIMIHRASAGAIGTGDDMRTMAAALDRVDAALAGIYAARTDLPLEHVTAMMAAETFMSSDEAVRFGFADSLLDAAAQPKPRVLASATPQSKRELEEQLRGLGFTRSIAAKMTNAAWAARSTEGEGDEIDLDRVASTISAHLSAMKPYA